MNKMEWEKEKQSFISKSHTPSHNYAELKIGAYRSSQKHYSHGAEQKVTNMVFIECMFPQARNYPGLITSHPVHQNSPDYYNLLML